MLPSGHNPILPDNTPSEGSDGVSDPPVDSYSAKRKCGEVPYPPKSKQLYIPPSFTFYFYSSLKNSTKTEKPYRNLGQICSCQVDPFTNPDDIVNTYLGVLADSTPRDKMSPL